MGFKKPPFLHGWVMVAIASIIPIMFSGVVGLILKDTNLDVISQGVVYKKSEDLSHIFNYFTFGLLHVILCLAITFYAHDVFRNSSTAPLTKIYKKHHISAFLIVSVIFIAIVQLLDTPLELLSNDILWIGLEKIKTNQLLFSNICNPYQCDFRLFDIMPIILVIAAFLPLSAIMLAIPHLVEKVDISQDKEPDEIISNFLNEFETLYYLLVGMLLSSGIATHFYLKTPLTTIDASKSNNFLNMMNATFSMWSIVYFLVLLMVLFFAYGLVSQKVRSASALNYIFTNTQKFKEIRTTINFHFLIKKKSALFASAFTPIFMMAIKQAVN